MEPLIQLLLASTAKASIVIVMLFAIFLVGSRWMTPRWRHLLWGLVVLRLLLPPVFQSELSLFNFGLPLEKPQESLAQSVAVAVEPVEVTELNSSVTPSAATPLISPPEKVLTLRERIESLPVYRIVFAVWLTGVAVLVFMTIWVSIRIHRSIGEESPCMNLKHLELLEACRKELGVGMHVALIETRCVGTPALLGILRPKILLPKSIAETLSPEDMRFVFLHELSHLKRRDLLVNWLVMTAQVLHWFNPLVWLAGMRMHAEREQACDEAVLSSIDESDRQSYGHALIELMGAQPAPFGSVGMVGILEKNRQLKRRIGMIRTFKKKSGWHAMIACTLVVVMALVTLTDAMAKPKAQTAKAAKTGQNAVGKIITIETKIVTFAKEAAVMGDKLTSEGDVTVATGNARVAFAKDDKPHLVCSPSVSIGNGVTAKMEMGKERKFSFTPTLVEGDVLLDIDASITIDAIEHRFKTKVRTALGEPVHLINTKGKLILSLTARTQDAEEHLARKAIEKKLETITITKASFADTRISTVFEFLKNRSRALDPEGEGLNFLYLPSKDKEEPVVTIAFDNVPLKTVTRSICTQAGLEYRVANHSVVIADAKTMKILKSRKPMRTAGPLGKKLATIKLTKVLFVDTQISTVLEFLKVRSRDLDPEGEGVNFILKLPKGKEEATITLDFDNAPLKSVIEHVCSQAGLECMVRDKAVYVGDFKLKR